MPSSEYLPIVEAIGGGAVRVDDVQGISGFVYKSFDGAFEHSDYTLLLKSGLRYGLRLTRFMRVQGTPYRLQYFMLNDNNIRGRFVFAQDPQPSA